MEIKSYSTYRLVKSEDLNHHGTLFAGRSAEWFVESGFIAASSLVPANNVVCVKIHGMQFTRAVKLGQIVCYTSKIVYAGKTSLICYVRVSLIENKEVTLLDGFLTFVHVDENTKPTPHGIVMEPKTEEDTYLQQLAKALPRTNVINFAKIKEETKA
ncbi:MAG: hotdog domain-containing protein [Bacteroidota bacterium]|nr:hotdog domain-containing protein [Bacteroidota bacterium]